MNELSRLNDVFQTFTMASKSLERYYEMLQEKVRYLTQELEETNKELKRSLNATEEARDYLKGVIQNIKDAIIVLDNQRNINMMNKAAEELFNISKEYVIGKSLDCLNFSIQQEGPDNILIVNKKRYNVILSCSNIGDRGYVVLIKDITKLKELELTQERNHRLIAMGEMVAKIVHEIRSPLCSVELYASMLSNELQDKRHAELAKGISAGISSLNNILTNMLLFAKTNKPVFISVDLRKVLNETLFMITPLLDAKKIVLINEIKQEVFILGDPELLKQVFLNIILNAVQATLDSGRIFISLKLDDEKVIIEIIDEGFGIDDENIERIFDPFFSTKEKGTGLGLTIASMIMQAHNGGINVRNKIDKGCCFQVYFQRRIEKVDYQLLGGVFGYETNSSC